MSGVSDYTCTSKCGLGCTCAVTSGHERTCAGRSGFGRTCSEERKILAHLRSYLAHLHLDIFTWRTQDLDHFGHTLQTGSSTLRVNASTHFEYASKHLLNLKITCIFFCKIERMRVHFSSTLLLASNYVLAVLVLAYSRQVTRRRDCRYVIVSIFQGGFSFQFFL